MLCSCVTHVQPPGCGYQADDFCHLGVFVWSRREIQESHGVQCTARQREEQPDLPGGYPQGRYWRAGGADGRVLQRKWREIKGSLHIIYTITFLVLKNQSLPFEEDRVGGKLRTECSEKLVTALIIFFWRKTFILFKLLKTRLQFK